MIEGGIELDLDAVRQNVQEAQVICVFFPILRRTLLVDTRTSADIGTFVQVVPMERTTADRLRSLRRLRPFFDRPDSLTMIPWEARVSSLQTFGVWDVLVGRLDDRAAAERCLARLCELEYRERRAAILGRRYQTLYSRVPTIEE